MNVWIGMGRLTKEPEITVTAENTIARYTLAVDRTKDTTDFIGCVAFGKNAEFAQTYLKKGTKIAVEGRIQTGSYKNKDGKTIFTTDVVVNRQEFVESKGKESKEESKGEFVTVKEDEGLPFK